MRVQCFQSLSTVPRLHVFLGNHPFLTANFDFKSCPKWKGSRALSFPPLHFSLTGLSQLHPFSLEQSNSIYWIRMTTHFKSLAEAEVWVKQVLQSPTSAKYVLTGTVPCRSRFPNNNKFTQILHQICGAAVCEYGVD
jgi:hypothetical protein